MNTVKRWNELTVEEKLDTCRKMRIVEDFCTRNVGKKILWSQINTWGLPHFYRFGIDDYNAVHQWTKMIFDDEGIMVIKVED